MQVVQLDPETVLVAYTRGAFPMTDRDGATRWYTADPRGVVPLDDRFHVPRTLRQTVRKDPHAGGFEIRFNYGFENVMRACRDTREDGSWISDQLIDVYCRLHEKGHAHSVEAWKNGELAGGLYGVSLGGAFFGESMFHFQRDASKVALVALVARLREKGFELLDAQASTPHLRTFGCHEISAAEYMRRLRRALEKECSFR
jgi:leucyl/phenylalanyl-tRNA--protein transferase